MMVGRSRSSLLIAMLLASVSLSACGTLNKTAGVGKGATATDTSQNSRLSDAIASAARDAQKDGMTQESLMFQSKLYHQDPNNPDKILNYARALRYTNRIDDAILVVRTPAKGPRATEPMMTEAAMILISAGQYDEALSFAQRAVEKNGKSVDAHHALALALSGLGKYEDAQLQFQETIQMWPESRDQTAVINNLAMSLAAQGKIAEARTAMSMATGEALRSQTYQNNRAMLEALKDRTPVKAEKLEPVIPEPVLVHEDIAEPKKSLPPVEMANDTKSETRTKRRTTPASGVKSKAPVVYEPVATDVPTKAAVKAVIGGKMTPIVE